MENNNNHSDLFLECSKNIVDFYNLTQEIIGSPHRMEYPENKPYYSCPECGAEFNPKEADIDIPDVYLQCECGYELSQDFYDDIMENYISGMADSWDGDR